MLDFGGLWEDYLHLVEFIYNNSYEVNIKIALFEALYGRKCKLPEYWDDIREEITWT